MSMFRSLKPEEVEVRVGQCSDKGCSLLLYKTARTDAILLDETVGPANWQCDYKAIDGKLYCGIGVRDDSETWIWKWDTGVESNMEAQKGEASDAFKRAGFKWGIGRELYTAPRIWVGADKCTLRDGKNGRKQCYDAFEVTEMEVVDGTVKRVVIANMSRRGEIVHGKPNEDTTEPQKQGKGRFDKAQALRAEALELGIAADGISGWVNATFGAKKMSEYTDAEVSILEGYLATLVSDKKALMEERDGGR